MPTPVDALNVPEIFFDGLFDVKSIEGVARMSLYSRHDGESVAVARLAIPISELPEMVQKLFTCMTQVQISEQPREGH